MEFTPSPSSIFQNKKIKYNNKKPTKNGIIWINFSKIRKARCTLTPLPLRSARLTQYMRFARCTSLSHILLRFTTQNIAYTQTLCKISLHSFCTMHGGSRQSCSAKLRTTDSYPKCTPKNFVFVVNFG
jgi:hypothetical protein